MNGLMTGYFATETSRSNVHIVKDNHRSVCGRKFKGQFQWCANGIYLEYVTCPKCKAIVNKRIFQYVLKLENK